MFEIPLVYKKYELNIEGKSSLNDPWNSHMKGLKA